jgi:hypothetical protein
MQRSQSSDEVWTCSPVKVFFEDQLFVYFLDISGCWIRTQWARGASVLPTEPNISHEIPVLPELGRVIQLCYQKRRPEVLHVTHFMLCVMSIKPSVFQIAIFHNLINQPLILMSI